MSYYEMIKQEMMDAGKFGALKLALEREKEVETFIDNHLFNEGIKESKPIIISILDGHFYALSGYIEELDNVLEDLRNSVSDKEFRKYIHIADDLFLKLKDSYKHKTSVEVFKFALSLINARLMDEEQRRLS